MYGTPDDGADSGRRTVRSGSPYGESKWIIERALHWADRVTVCARRRCATSTPRERIPPGGLGEDHRPETHLIPLVIDAALGRQHEAGRVGDDYPRRMEPASATMST